MHQRTPTPILYDRSHLNLRTADGATKSRTITTGTVGNLQRRSEQPRAALGGRRYGEGMLYDKNAGDLKVFWQGPTLGWDFGGEGARTMMLVYNLPRDPGGWRGTLDRGRFGTARP
jgi:hypothetical protein